MYPRESWKITLVYFLVVTYFLFYLHRSRFFLFPMGHLVESPPSDHYEEIYLENEMGVWVYSPSVSTHTSVENIMIYFNGNAGNVSTRIANIRVLQHLFPDYKIYNLEYPGYGISAHLSLSLDNIISECSVACENIVRRHPSMECLGMWGESLGALILSRVVAKNSSLPVTWMVHMNGVVSLSSTIGSFIPFLLHALILPVLPCSEDTASLYSTTLQGHQKLVLIHSNNDEVVSGMQTKNLYLSLKSKFPDQVHYLELRGKHNGVLLHKENQEALQDFFQRVLPSE